MADLAKRTDAWSKQIGKAIESHNSLNDSGLVFFGLDPGKSGAISAIFADGTPHEESCYLNRTDADIVDWLLQFNLSNSRSVIEAVSAMPKQGVSSTFKFGRQFGFNLGVMAALRMPYLSVSPSKWQTDMKCRTKGDKNVTKAAAQQRWPHLKIVHANADSLLLAEYGRTNLWKDG